METKEKYTLEEAMKVIEKAAATAPLKGERKLIVKVENHVIVDIVITDTLPVDPETFKEEDYTGPLKTRY